MVNGICQGYLYSIRLSTRSIYGTRSCGPGCSLCCLRGVDHSFRELSVQEESLISTDLKNVFPCCTEEMHYLLLKFLLGSLLHAKSYLLEMLKSDSPLRSNVALAFRRRGVESSSQWISVRYAHEGRVYLTGIPPHIIQLVKLEKVLGKVDEQRQEQKTIAIENRVEIVSAISADLDSRSVGGGGEISIHRIEQLLQPVHERMARFEEALLRSNTTGTAASQGDQHRVASNIQWHSWGGKFRIMYFQGILVYYPHGSPGIMGIRIT